MKRTLTILAFFGAALCATATVNPSEQINAIQKSPQFLYAEVTMAQQQEAASLAYKMLIVGVNEWAAGLSNRKMAPEKMEHINQYIDTITARRANLYRVFVYVEKARLLADATTEETIVQADTIHNIVIAPITHYDVLEQIKQARYFFELQSIMEPLKANGSIIDYGKFSTAPNVTECYLIVYDPAGNIKALLGKGTSVRPNLKTGKNDQLNNYRGCGAIWFTLKN